MTVDTVRRIVGPTILLHSGNYFDYEAPEESAFDIVDIARGLSHICRFAGQCGRFYSVAEHSVYVSQIVAPEHALAGLMHDASEAFVGDMAKPLKVMCPDYVAIEKRVESAVLDRFGIALPLHPSIKEADIVMLATEQAQIMRNRDDWEYTRGRQMADLTIQCLAPDDAMRLFLHRYEELTGQSVVPAEPAGDEPDASSRCPVCGLDEPHQHSGLEAMELRGRRFPITNEEWLSYAGRTVDPALINELDMLHKKAVRLATPSNPDGLVEAVRTTIARCEALEDEASNELVKADAEHAQGYWRGQKRTAKSIRRELHDLTRSALSAPAPCGWRTIDSAPKDGTTIDVWRDGTRETVYWGLPPHECGEMGSYCDSDWHSIKGPRWVCSTFGEFVGGKHDPFTHWMPLPAAPALDGEKGE